MSHDPERCAAEYLGGAMSARGARRFEAHLVECDQCWQEMAEGRAGRQIAESARELASAGLRDDVRAVVARLPRRHRSRWVAGLAASLAIVLVIAVSASAPRGTPAARPDRRGGGRLSEGEARGVRPPARPAPELPGTGLSLVAQGGGAVGALAVDAYAFHDDRGHRLLLYLSDRPFPVAAGAHRSPQPECPWVASDSGVEMLCASDPKALLALSDDAALLRRVAAVLGVQGVPA